MEEIKPDEYEVRKLEEFKKTIFKKAFENSGLARESLNANIRQHNGQKKLTVKSAYWIVDWLQFDVLPVLCEQYHQLCIESSVVTPKKEVTPPQMTIEEMRIANLQATLKSAMDGQSGSQLTAAKILGQIIEKQEIQHKFEVSPEQYITIGRKVIGQLRERLAEHGGVCVVCSRPVVLLDQVRISPEQERKED